MKNLKFGLILLLASFAFVACEKDPKEEPKAEQEKLYEVQVKFTMPEEDKPLMHGGDLLLPTATLKEKEGKRVLIVEIKEMKPGVGIVDLFYMEKPVKKTSLGSVAHNSFEITIDGASKADGKKQERLVVGLSISNHGDIKMPVAIVIDHNTKKEKSK